MTDTDEKFGGPTLVIRNTPGMMRTVWLEDNPQGKWLCLRQWQEKPNGDANVKTIRLDAAETKMLREFLLEATRHD